MAVIVEEEEAEAAVTKKTAKIARKPTRKRRTVETFGFVVQIQRSFDLRLKLSPSGARGARASLESALAAGSRFGAAQLRLDARDLKSIYLCLGPAQAKKLVGRLKALELGSPEVSR
jgi:hypothetical protein